MTDQSAQNVEPLSDEELAQKALAAAGQDLMKLSATNTGLSDAELAARDALSRAEQENKRLREALTELMAFDSAAYDRKSDRAKALLAAKHKARAALSPSQVKTE